MLAITRLPSPRMNECELTFATRTPIDYERALEQHVEYRELLRACGAEVVVMPASDDLPDCVFVEDTAVVLDEVAVIASPGAASRRGELDAVEAVVKRYRPIERIRLPATLDGGDVLCVGRMVLVGRSSRTDAAGIAALRAIVEPLRYRVWPVDIRNCLHLKSACTALDDDVLLVNRDWLDAAALDVLGREFRLVETPSGEPFAADVLRIGRTICVSAAHPRTAELIGRLGYDVRTIDLSEFAKAEGGVTCLSIVLN